MPSPEHEARKAELTTEIEETRGLIKALTQRIQPLIEEFKALEDYEILEVSDTWLDSPETIELILDKSWNNGRGNALADELIADYIKSLRPEGIGRWVSAGHYEVKDRPVRAISVYIGLNKETSAEQYKNIAKSINKLRITIGSVGEDYYLPIIQKDDFYHLALYPATNEVVAQDWGRNTVVYTGEFLEDALEFVAKSFPCEHLDSELRAK